MKFFHGGWFPIVVGAVIFLLMTTWATGRRLVRARMSDTLSSDALLLVLETKCVWSRTS